MRIVNNMNPAKVKNVLLEIRSEECWANRHDNLRNLDERPERGEVYVRSRDGYRSREVYKKNHRVDPRIGFYSEWNNTEPGKEEFRRIQQAAVPHSMNLENGHEVEVKTGQILIQETNKSGQLEEYLVDPRMGTIAQFFPNE